MHVLYFDFYVVRGNHLKISRYFFFQEWQERKDHLLKNKDILYKTIRPTFSDIDMERLEKKNVRGSFRSTTSKKKMIKNGGKHLSERNIILMHVIIIICVLKKNKRIFDLITWFYYLFNYTIFLKLQLLIRTVLKII